MVRSKFNPAFNPVLPHRLGFGIAQNLRILWLLLFALVFLACTTLPTPETKTMSFSYEPHPDSRLAVVTRNLIEDAEDGTSGFFKLFRNDDAMRWRLLLADMAEETLDMQYFIWKGDASGELLLDRVIMPGIEPGSAEEVKAAIGFLGRFNACVNSGKGVYEVQNPLFISCLICPQPFENV